MWTDQELDRALADQPAGPAFSPEARARALARLRVTPVRRRISRPVWFAAAASVVVLAGLGYGIAGGGTPAASAAAVAQLDRASAATSGESTAPGQYFRTETHLWALGAAQTRTGKPLAQLQETVIETWVPHERSREWVRVETVTGRTQWLVGDDDLVRREGGGGLPVTPGRTRLAGPCGDYPSDNGDLGGPAALPCDERAGDWYEPTPRFVAGLPREPEQLYRRLADDAGAHGEADMLRMAKGVLTADVPRDVRANLYRALRLMPGLDVTSDAVNLDGRRGVALGVNGPATRQELVLDPATGRLIGERLVLTAPGTGAWQGLPAGTVAEYTAVTTEVVRRPGA